MNDPIKPKLSITLEEIKNFVCWDKRIKDEGWEFALVGGLHQESDGYDQYRSQKIQDKLTKIDPERAHWDIIRANHWAVGWYDHLIVDPTYEPVMKILAQE